MMFWKKEAERRFVPFSSILVQGQDDGLSSALYDDLRPRVIEHKKYSQYVPLNAKSATFYAESGYQVKILQQL